MKKNGFTLTEMLITITIFLLVSIAIFNLFSFGQKFYSQGSIQAELLQNGRIILERMTREIRQTNEIVSNLYDDETTATSTIMFEDGHSATTYRYIHYFMASSSEENNLVKREVIGYYFSEDPEQTLVPWTPETENLVTITLEDPYTIGEYVNNLKIWGVEVIDISMTLEKNNQSINLETKVFGRNL